MLPSKRLYKEYFDMTDYEVDQVMEELEQEKAEAAEAQMQQQAAAQPQPGAQPGYGEAGGQEGAENATPTSQPPEGTPPMAESINKLTGIIDVSEEEKLILERILSRQINKLKNSQK
jgi:hypothetical protein